MIANSRKIVSGYGIGAHIQLPSNGTQQQQWNHVRGHDAGNAMVLFPQGSPLGPTCRWRRRFRGLWKTIPTL